MAKQEAGQLLARLPQCAHGCQAGPHQIADCFMSLVGNPDRGQFASPMQLSEIDRIPPVGLVAGGVNPDKAGASLLRM
jgi:hypothetical protein